MKLTEGLGKKRKTSFDIELPSPRIPVTDEANQEILHLNDNKTDDIKKGKTMAVNNYVEVTQDNHNIETARSNKEYTIHDYEELDSKDKITYDKRSNLKLFKDELILRHSIYSLIFKRSLFDPIFLRILNLTFLLSFQLTLSALTMTDGYIDSRLKNIHRVYKY
jgi:hypothetical protein